MQYRDSIFGSLLKPLLRWRFDAIVARHRGDAYGKSFGSWAHLVTLIFAQLARVESLRALAACWNAHTHHHYHLGAVPVARSARKRAT